MCTCESGLTDGEIKLTASFRAQPGSVYDLMQQVFVIQVEIYSLIDRTAQERRWTDRVQMTGKVEVV